MMRQYVVGLLTVGSVLAAPVSAQDFSEVQIKAEAVAGNIHVLFGAGGNIGVSAGKDGIFIVDDQFAPLSEKISAALKNISTEPVRYVINTHFHFDHTGGNENFGKQAAVIVAHDNVRTRLKDGTLIEAFNYKTEPAPDVALPSITFNQEMSLHLNGEDARIIHVPNAHTDGDGIIYFKGSNVVHMGDVYFEGRLPFVDVQHGGSVMGTVAAVDRILKLVNQDTKIIPGHGPVSNPADLKAYRDVLENVHRVVADQKRSGMSLAEIVAVNPFKKMQPAWLKPDSVVTKTFIEMVYNAT